MPNHLRPRLQQSQRFVRGPIFGAEPKPDDSRIETKAAGSIKVFDGILIPADSQASPARRHNYLLISSEFAILRIICLY